MISHTRRAVQAGQQAWSALTRVGLLALGNERALAGPTLVKPHLNVGRGKGQTRRAAIDHAAERRTVALAPGRHAKEMAKTVVRHDALLTVGSRYG